jgi:hypothetical protein
MRASNGHPYGGQWHPDSDTRHTSRMTKTASRTRYYRFPYSEEIFDSRIERLAEAPGPRNTTEIHVDLRVLRVQGPAEISLANGRPSEVLRGELAPLRLRFLRAEWGSRTGFFADLDVLPDDHTARRLFDVVHIRAPGQKPRYWLFADINAPGHELSVCAAECVLEERPGEPVPVEVCRQWTWRPPVEAGLVRRAPVTQRRFGGDPVAIHLGRRLYRRRLFIGGLHHQCEYRPLVDRVVNLADQPNPWIATYGMHPADRHATKGELVDGMTAEDLLAEAQAVIEQLRAGERVLAHCYAGVNRSSTLCCATLMLLEGLSAEAALSRVRETHPEAAPDPYHWLLLKWLERRGADLDADTHIARVKRSEGVRPLRDALAIR